MSSLSFADSSTDTVDFGAGSALNTLATATVLWWFTVNSLNNRQCLTKTTTGQPAGFNSFVTAANNVRLILKLVTTSAVVETNVAFVVGQPMFIGFSWNATGGGANPKAYAGDQRTPAVDASNVTAAGSGAVIDDSAYKMSFGNIVNGGGSGAMPCRLHGLWVYNRQLDIEEIRDQQDQFAPAAPGCVGAWRPGAHGTAIVFDESGYGNHGPVTGTVPLPPDLADLLPRTRVRRSAKAVAAAGGLSIPVVGPAWLAGPSRGLVA